MKNEPKTLLEPKIMEALRRSKSGYETVMHANGVDLAYALFTTDPDYYRLLKLSHTARELKGNFGNFTSPDIDMGGRPPELHSHITTGFFDTVTQIYEELKASLALQPLQKVSKP